VAIMGQWIVRIPMICVLPSLTLSQPIGQ
jgi:hypothetical protein